jgi:hypothetical protein
MSLPLHHGRDHALVDRPGVHRASHPETKSATLRQRQHQNIVWLHRLFPVVILMTLLAALWAGLARLGWAVPLLTPTLAAAHGPLMVGGFLGALISLERAVAVRKRWAYLAPLCSVTGALMAIAGLAPFWPALLITLGSLILLAVLIHLWRTVPALFTATIALGGLLWWAGNLLWLLGFALPMVVYWWAAFLVLTIAGERLELSRMLRLSVFARTAFALICLTILAGPLLSLLHFAGGVRLLGVGLLCLACWLGRYDIARRRVRVAGQARYMALALLSGYLWLGSAGLLALYFGGVMAGPAYDALLHTLFVGFILAMIFAHALIILPVFTGYAITYTAAFYVPLTLLHLTLVLRVAGDLLLYWPARLWGGLLNAVVLLLFFVLLLTRLTAPPPVRPPHGSLRDSCASDA